MNKQKGLTEKFNYEAVSSNFAPNNNYTFAKL